MKLIIIIVLVLNALTFQLYRLAWGGKMKITRPGGNPVAVGIPGIFSTARTYDFLGEKVVSLSYDNRGFCLAAAIEQVRQEIARTECPVVAISMGALIVPAKKDLGVILVNPFLKKECLKSKALQKVLNPATAVGFKMIIISIGWIGYLPILQNGTSLALVADQLWALATASSPVEDYMVLGLVLSSRDELLQNAAIRDIVNDVPNAIIDAGHAETGDKAEEYREAILGFVK